MGFCKQFDTFTPLEFWKNLLPHPPHIIIHYIFNFHIPYMCIYNTPSLINYVQSLTMVMQMHDIILQAHTTWLCDLKGSSGEGYCKVFRQCSSGEGYCKVFRQCSSGEDTVSYLGSVAVVRGTVRSLGSVAVVRGTVRYLVSVVRGEGTIRYLGSVDSGEGYCKVFRQCS